jgi:8-oxo-dGTP pyrophosphatase MutT (NUDIX family)
MKKVEYVVGFLFSKSKLDLVLIKKDHPEWMKGLLNGVGGHVEPEELPDDAMRREFLEETGVDIDSWKKFAVLRGPKSIDHEDGEFAVSYYVAFSDYAYNCRTKTREEVFIFNVLYATMHPDDMLPNLRWAIPMALSMERDRADSFEIVEMH